MTNRLGTVGLATAMVLTTMGLPTRVNAQEDPIPPRPGATVEIPDEAWNIVDSVTPVGTLLIIPPLDVSGQRFSAGSDTCTFYDTSYAAGGRDEGEDTAFGVDAVMGAHASAHSNSPPLLNFGANRSAHAWANAGLSAKVQIKGTSSLPVTFTLPWGAAGQIRTARECFPVGVCTEADATSNVVLNVKDVTANSSFLNENVYNPSQSGDSFQRYGRTGSRSVSLSVVDGHRYQAYVHLGTSASTKGQLLNPILQADSFNDFFSGGYRAWLDYVQIRIDAPGWIWATCPG